MIVLQSFSVSLGGAPVLHNIDFAAGPGEFVALCGPNGAGKTTLLRALAGLLPNGRPMPRRIAYVEQGARCAWALTVEQVAALGRIPHGDQNQAAIDRAIEATGLQSLRHARIDRISGGQARRAMLARALATEPQILLLDEPVADLDPAAAHGILALLAGLARQGRTIVAVLHAVEYCPLYATRVVVLNHGTICADAPPAIALPEAAHAFGLPWQADPAFRLLPPLDKGLQ